MFFFLILGMKRSLVLDISQRTKYQHCFKRKNYLETTPAPQMLIRLTMPNLIPIQTQLAQPDPMLKQIIFPSMIEILQKHWKSVAETTFDTEISRKLSDYHSKRLDAFPWNVLFHHIHGLYKLKANHS